MATMYEKMMERLVDRIERQAVEIATLKQEAENLKKEMAYYDDLHQKVREDLDEVRRDFHAANQAVGRLEYQRDDTCRQLQAARALLEQYYELHHAQGVYNAGGPEAYQKIPFEPAITVTIETGKFLHPEQKELAKAS